ncbi:MAG: hypothetical protein ACE5G2_07890 [Candidatus Krumholzibacteriia bacterium]
MRTGPVAAILWMLVGFGPACQPGGVRPVLVRLPAMELGEAPVHARTCALAAFDVPVLPDGRVDAVGVRLIGWEAAAADPHALVRMRGVAEGSLWEPRAGASGDAGSGRAALLLDCAGKRPGAPRTPRWRTFERRVRDALQARRRAVSGWRQLAGPESVAPRVHELDVVWSDLATFHSRTPFVFDEIRPWREIGPRLRESQERWGGFWVCRVARTTHTGQFMFLDGERRLLALAQYWIGE